MGSTPEVKEDAAARTRWRCCWGDEEGEEDERGGEAGLGKGRKKKCFYVRV